METEQTLPAGKTNDDMYSKKTAYSKIVGKVEFNQSERSVNVDQRVMLNFADDERKLLLTLLEKEKIIFMGMQKEYIIKKMKEHIQRISYMLKLVEDIKSKISA